MSYVCLFGELILIFLALFGVYTLIRLLADAYFIRKEHIRVRLVLENCLDTEYAVRLLQSRFLCGDYTGLFTGLTLDASVKADDKLLKKLKKEFPNIAISPIPTKTVSRHTKE